MLMLSDAIYRHSDVIYPYIDCPTVMYIASTIRESSLGYCHSSRAESFTDHSDSISLGKRKVIRLYRRTRSGRSHGLGKAILSIPV